MLFFNLKKEISLYFLKKKIQWIAIHHHHHHQTVNDKKKVVETIYLQKRSIIEYIMTNPTSFLLVGHCGVYSSAKCKSLKT